MKIVYQGSPGAYSHLAAKKIYPEYEFIPYNTFEDCFKHCNKNEEHKTNNTSRKFYSWKSC